MMDFDEPLDRPLMVGTVSFSISLKTFKCVQQRIMKFVVGRSWAEVS